MSTVSTIFLLAISSSDKIGSWSMTAAGSHSPLTCISLPSHPLLMEEVPLNSDHGTSFAVLFSFEPSQG